MIALADSAATEALGARLAMALRALDDGLVLSLAGELGVGKTALARAAITALGHAGPVVSPSYTLIEPYVLGRRTLYHMDLYRLTSPDELEYLGIRDIDSSQDWLWIEWAAHGAGFLPAIDVEVALSYAEIGRKARISAYSERGRRFLSSIEMSR